MIKINYKKNNSTGGFTIMETMVAIFIIMLAITGPMVFTQNALRAAFLSRDQITAFFLAQDAIEYIKNIRDGHVVNIINSPSDTPDGWMGNGKLRQYCMGDDNDNKGCTVDTKEAEDQIRSCQTEGTPGCVVDGSDNLTKYTPLNYKDNAYFTNKDLSGGTIVPSLFAREIKMKDLYKGDPIKGNREVEVTVTIRWKSHEGVGTREVVVKENIFNWANALISQSTP